MFTGLIEEIGTVASLDVGSSHAKIAVKARKVLEGTRIGDSISTNGVCLTVVHMESGLFVVDVMPETMRRSNLGGLGAGSPVNLERALRLGDRLGGHLVSGHIDGVGKVLSRKDEGNAIWVEIGADPSIMRYVIEKGSVALDGTSLTVADTGMESFRVSIIPLTQQHTTLTSKALGAPVNVECDMFGKYLDRFMLFEEKAEKKNPIDLQFLKDNGFA
ncbi:riboflavin synthase [Anaerotalea alkaliphila]|uniref:Riboflavin synthase n=1 Tax=Anaerotalea alkaliphila TaxID=2662126 RepID=A0A7X5KME4_9FIRM|nr:riboflavin synthase [Anaerotalea alkaliphila]NDL66618.1 riboflavin synthase [Anaerotalea alkaliphila]